MAVVHVEHMLRAQKKKRTNLHITLLRCFIPIVIPSKFDNNFIDPHMHATRSTSFVILDIIIVIFGDG